MKKHGNCNENDEEHHLYEIRDKKYKDVYKYGICGGPLNPDGTSPRAQIQVNEFNRAVRWLRFFANVLLKGIPGRVEAKKLETEYNQRYKDEHGHFPPGN
jgi:hypothetical protein